MSTERPQFWKTVTLSASAAAIALSLGCSKDKQPTPSADLSSTPLSEKTDNAPTLEKLYDDTRAVTIAYAYNRQKGISEKKLMEFAQELTRQKATLIATNSPDFSKQYIIPKDNDNLVIYGRNFNLKNPSEFPLAAALTDKIFQDFNLSNLRGKPNFAILRQKLDNHENLFWLADNVQLEIADASPILRTHNLELLARNLQILKAAGIKTPQKIKVIQEPASDKRYEGTDENTATMFSGADPAYSAIIRYLDITNHNFGQNFSRIVSQTVSDNPRSEGYRVTDIQNISQNLDHEFQQTLWAYINQGVKMRNRILFAQTKGYTQEAKVLQTRYDFIKTLLDGQEFSIDGKIKRSQSYHIGDTIVIEDYDKQYPGILLRPTPTLALDPKWQAIYDGYPVKIIDAPYIATDDFLQKAVRMWKVEVVPGVQGYVSDEWFGQKLEPRNNR